MDKKWLMQSQGLNLGILIISPVLLPSDMIHSQDIAWWLVPGHKNKSWETSVKSKTQRQDETWGLFHQQLGILHLPAASFQLARISSGSMPWAMRGSCAHTSVNSHLAVPCMGSPWFCHKACVHYSHSEKHVALFCAGYWVCPDQESRV